MLQRIYVEQGSETMKIKPAIKLLDVSTSDPDDARRRRLLNIILSGFVLIAFVAVVIIGSSILTGLVSATEFATLFLTALVFLIGNILVLIINRYWSGLVAS